MAYKYAPELITRNRGTKMIEIRFFRHLTESSTAEEWEKEVIQMREESTNEFVVAARVNRAKRAWLWTNWTASVQEPTEEALEATSQGVIGWSKALDHLPEGAAKLTLPWKSDVPSITPKKGSMG